jgi:deoxyribonuclease-4
MLIGAHVSPAGGLAKAVARGLDLECDAIQIFNQSPRMWKPTAYTDEDFAAFREAMDGTRIKSVIIHAVYLINCASEDKELRKKSLTSLTHSLRVGDGIGADGVVLHAGSALQGDVGKAIKRAGPVIKAALAATDGCQLHLENTAGAGGTLGRSFTELAGLMDAAGGHERIGFCLDSCHLLASGYDVRTPDAIRATLDAFDEAAGAQRLRSLHVNDSVTPLGSNRDRHAPVGKGEMGEDGCAAFLTAPAFENLPCILETPGDGDPPGGPAREQIELTEKLRSRGRKARGLS